MGELPEWYSTIQAAKYLGVAPWDLADKPLAWKEWAISASRAEAEANQEIRKRHERKAGAKRKPG